MLFAIVGIALFQVLLSVYYPAPKRKRAWHGLYGICTIIQGILFLFAGLDVNGYLMIGFSILCFVMGVNSLITASKFK